MTFAGAGRSLQSCGGVFSQRFNSAFVASLHPPPICVFFCFAQHVSSTPFGLNVLLSFGPRSQTSDRATRARHCGWCLLFCCGLGLVRLFSKKSRIMRPQSPRSHKLVDGSSAKRPRYLSGKFEFVKMNCLARSRRQRHLLSLRMRWVCQQKNPVSRRLPAHDRPT